MSLLVLDTGISPQIPEILIGQGSGSDRSRIDLGHEFAEVAAARLGLPAITAAGQTWKYGRLLAAARTVAAHLSIDPAFSPGQPVVLLLPNSAEYLAAFYGILLARGVVVPLPPRTEAGLRRHVCESTCAARLITNAPVVRTQPDLQGLTAQMLDLEALPNQEGAAPSKHGHADPAELAAIFFTAGSTGTPKGVMLSHGNLLSNARAIAGYQSLRESDRPLCVLPFHHAFGNSVLQSHLLAGAHVVLDGQTAFPQTIVEALARHGCTSLAGVPDLFRMLLERSSLGSAPLPALRHMAVAGGALRHGLALDVARRIAPAEFFVMYGQTEATARLTFVPPAQLAELGPGCIGGPIPGVTLRVVDAAGDVLPAGETGELRARGPGIMQGYWRDPAGTGAQLGDGWLRTGDLASIDAAGRVYHRGRASAIVKIAGFRVHPGDLEEFALRRLPTRHAVAVPFESPLLGTRLALYLMPDPATGGMTQSEIIACCRAELPRHLVPDLVELVDEMPLNHALKIDRPLLSKLAEEASARRLVPA